MPTIKYTKEDITKLVDELDQYKKAHDKLTAGLKEAVAESIKYKRERDTLIKDVEKLREEKEDLKQEYELLKKAHSSSWAEKDKVIKKLSYKYRNLTEHIRNKALNNPSEHRYFRLVHFIDDLEDE